MSDDKKDIGTRIRDIRKSLQLNQGEFALPLKISVPGLSDLENGKYRPSHEFLSNMVTHYNVNLYHIMFGKGPVFLDPERLFDDAKKNDDLPNPAALFKANRYRQT